MWVAQLEVHNLRNLAEVEVQLEPGLNIFYGRNAQGKTSLLEAVGLVARARSFRTEETRGIIQRGAGFAEARATVEDGTRKNRLSVRIGEDRRLLSVDGREVAPREYYGRLEVAVYSTERLRVIRGGKRERRQFIDRAAGALWPTYRQVARDFDRAHRQRNAALERGSADIGSWTDRFIELGATLRQRRSDYVRRVAGRLSAGYRPAQESYRISVEPDLGDAAEDRHREQLAAEIERIAARERAAQRSLAGPHRDEVSFNVDDEDIEAASAGQIRSLLLAVTLASLEVYDAETGTKAVALLDDLDSELDGGRTRELCQEVVRRGQALVTTAHPDWVTGMAGARVYEVVAGRVRAA